jgi:selenide,water dikinase
VISTAIKRGQAKQEWIEAATASMTTLNKRAAEVMTGGSFGVHAMTDITGFGLIGHAREMSLGSKISLRIFASKVPLLEGALECVHEGFVPGGLKANRDFAECLVGYEAGVPEEIRTLLFDPQTAGGLLISVASCDSDRLLNTLRAAQVPAVVIGEVVEARKPTIEVCR